MTGPVVVRLPAEPDVVAPDGSDVRILAGASRGSGAHFSLRPGAVSAAVRHRTVEEIWFVLAGAGVMWLSPPDGPPVEVELVPGVSLSIPVGTAFQFRSTGDVALEAFGVTMPPWPGPDEAEPVEGRWEPEV